MKPKRQIQFSIIARIILAFILMGAVLLFAMSRIISVSMTKLEESLIVDHLETDINYIVDLLADYMGVSSSTMKWSLDEDGDLLCDGVQLVRGEANIKPGVDSNPALVRVYKTHEQKTGTNSYIFVRSSDDNLEEDEGHYIRALGSTRGPDGKSIVGTYISKVVADVIDRGEVFSGPANVSGRMMYCIYEPLFDVDENVIGCIVVGRDITVLEDTVREAVSQVRLLLILCIGLCSVALIVYMYFWVRSIGRIKAYLGQIGTGHFPDHPLEIPNRDELGAVAVSINEMTESLKEKERIGAELAVATSIQADLLPSIFPAFPDHVEFDIYATMSPAKEVGGDFYDFFMTDDKHVAIVIADVSGKGVPAALFMMTSKTLIKDNAQLGLEPAEVFTRVNRTLCEGNSHGLFVTGWMGILNIETGLMTYVNAGHNPPVLFSQGEVRFLRSKPGFVLAGLDTIRYKQSELQLQPGDRIYLYTDGVTEATSAENELYGDARLLNYLTVHQKDGIEAVLRGVRADLDVFVGEAEQFDDITMLLLDFKQRLNSGAVERVFPAAVEALEAATAFLEEEMERAEVPPKCAMQLSVALEELFVNVAHYAYPNRSGNVTLSIGVQDRVMTLILKDSGIPFDPLSREDPDITLSADERSIGGLGILMVKKSMDQVLYQYKEGMNILTLVKSF